MSETGLLVVTQDCWVRTVSACSKVRQGVETMWSLGRTLRGIWEQSHSPSFVQRNSEDHNTKLTVFICCVSLALLGEVFGSRPPTHRSYE